MTITSPTPTTTGTSASAWGWFPALALVAAFGLLGVAVSYTGSRFSYDTTELFFWAGLLLIFLPGAFRLMRADVSRREAICCLLTIGVMLYGVKVLHSPDGFTLFDELLHWRTANDIVRFHHLYTANTLLPVSPIFVALENTTNAMLGLTGLPIFWAGVLVVGVARCVLILSLYLLFERVGLSLRGAALGTLLYMANANFLFFDAQFAYESFGLAFTLFALYAVAQAGSRPLGEQAVWTAMALLSIGATVTTHHVTSYVLVAFLALWMLVRYAARALHLPHSNDPDVAGFTLVAVLMALAWLVFAASIVVTYLAEPIGNGLREFVRLVSGEQRSRELFRAEGGYVQPRWEQLTGFASVIAVLLGMPFGLWAVWQRHHAHALALALGVASLAYPATLGLRFTTVGAEISGRLTAFLYVPLAFIFAAAFASWAGSVRDFRRGVVAFAFTLYAGLILIGGVVTGFGPSVARLPGPYLVSADSRSIEPEGLQATAWMRATFGPDNRVAADRVNGALLGAYGEQNIVTDIGNRVDFSPVFFSPTDGGDVREVLHRGRIVYLVIDRRITQALPLFGFYIQPGENDGQSHYTPVDPMATDKYDRIPGVSRLFDSGNIIIYDVRGLASAP